MGKYILHWRGAEHYLVLIDCFLDSNYYGKFDYRVLISKHTDAVFLTERGVKQQYNFGKQLLDKNFVDSISLEIEQAIVKMKDVSVLTKWKSNTELNKSELLEVWEVTYNNLKNLCSYYLYSEHPILAPLDEIVSKACKKDKDVLVKVLSNPKLADELKFSDREKQALYTSLKMGEFKLKLHISFEPWLQALVEFSKVLGKKYNLSSNQILCMRHKEFDELIRFEKIPSAKILNDRYKGAVLIAKNGIVNCLTGSDYIEWNEKLEDSLPNEILGISTYPGKVKGIVKLHMDWMGTINVPKDSILVTGMTNPQIIPLLKKVKAIITDEGGLTCHAAIVSWEFKIPCIVACQNATQKLKDGDIVEVNANKGIVRKINK